MRHLIPFPVSPLCFSPTCFHRVLDEPLFVRFPVADANGVQYDFDIAPTQGFFLVLFVFLFFNVARSIATKD